MGRSSKQQPKFELGDRVFAKLKGYSHWPARIEQTPKETKKQNKYKVLFYGTYQTIILKAEFIVLFNEQSKAVYGKQRKQKSFNDALWEIENDPDLKELDLESNEENEEEGDGDGEEENKNGSDADVDIEESKSNTSDNQSNNSENDSIHFEETLSNSNNNEMSADEQDESIKNSEDEKSESSNNKDKKKISNKLKKIKQIKEKISSSEPSRRSQRNSKRFQSQISTELTSVSSTDSNLNDLETDLPKKSTKKQIDLEFKQVESSQKKVKIEPEVSSNDDSKAQTSKATRRSGRMRKDQDDKISINDAIKSDELEDAKKLDLVIKEEKIIEDEESEPKTQRRQSNRPVKPNSKYFLENEDTVPRRHRLKASKSEENFKTTKKINNDENSNSTESSKTDTKESTDRSPSSRSCNSEFSLVSSTSNSTVDGSSEVSDQIVLIKSEKTISVEKKNDEEKKIFLEAQTLANQPEQPELKKNNEIKDETISNLNSGDLYDNEEEEVEDEEEDKKVKPKMSNTSKKIDEEKSKKNESSVSLKVSPDQKSKKQVKMSQTQVKIEQDDTQIKSEYRKKALEEMKKRWQNLSETERKSEIEKMKLKKIQEKKLAKIRSIRIHLALLRMDVEIKKSLRVDNTDVERCYLIMEDLIKLPFSQKHLFKAPEIVETIRKCRKFKDSEKVKQMATECFYKFHYMFSILPGETFWSVFERERDKYLSENVEELKKERILANKISMEDANNSLKKKQSTTTLKKIKKEPIDKPNVINQEETDGKIDLKSE